MTFQKINCNIVEDRKYLGPMEVLEEVRKVVDRFYPPKTFDGMVAINEKKIMPVGRKEVPVRILMALYACKSIENSLRK
jgi:hypothetical protein